MKFRVISLETGKKVKLADGEFFMLRTNGAVCIVADSDDVSFDLNTDHIVEFAFNRDQLGKWIWEHSVLSD